MCGGGGGDASEIADRQQAAEAQRQSQIAAAVAAINKAFDSYGTEQTLAAIAASPEFAALKGEQEKRTKAREAEAKAKATARPRSMSLAERLQSVQQPANVGYTINQDGTIALPGGQLVSAGGELQAGGQVGLLGMSPEKVAAAAARRGGSGQAQAGGDSWSALLSGWDEDLAAQARALEKKYRTGGREAMYADRAGAVKSVNLRELDRQAGDSRRNLKFNLARAGLAGGSSDVDSQAELARRYNEGTLKVSQLADEAGSDLRMADERARMSLIGQAQAGLDATSATQLALKNLEANSAAAQAVGQYQSLGDLMSDLADYYGVSRYLLGRREAASNPGGRSFGASPSSPGMRQQGTVT
jgi:hypothetical protein